MSDVVPIPARIYENTVRTLETQKQEIARLQAVVDAARNFAEKWQKADLVVGTVPAVNRLIDALRTLDGEVRP